jgi:pyruvate dehydrogenase E1 component alpha subunit
MAPGSAAAGRARGGEDIQAPRPGRARLATAAAAVLCAAGLALATAFRHGGHDLLLLGVGGAALLPLLLGLAIRWSPGLTLGVGLLGAQQALRLALGSDELDTWAPASAGVLLFVAELAWWSIEPRVPAWAETALAPLRLVRVVGVCAAGASFALEREDWIFPSYRESAIGLLRGMPAATILSWWRGHPSGWWNPAEFNVASICVPIATHVPHAAGLAWGKKLRGESTCAIAYFGDGATSEGAFHEGANFAAVMRAPVVLFCNNNQWAISTPLEAQTAAETLADKAVGYGMPGVRVDGADVLAVYEATREAVGRARAGEGPTLIEAVTYRAAPHATADDPTAYIDLERVEEERRRECVGRYEAYLRRLGVLSKEAAEAVRAEAVQLLRDGIAAAEAEPPADPSLVFSHAYVDPPAGLQSDLAELKRVLGG